MIVANYIAYILVTNQTQSQRIFFNAPIEYCTKNFGSTESLQRVLPDSYKHPFCSLPFFIAIVDDEFSVMSEALGADMEFLRIRVVVELYFSPAI